MLDAPLSPPALAPFKEALPAPSHADGRTNLVGMSREELGDLFKTMGEPAFRAKQLWGWIYGKGARDFADMTDMSKKLRAKLEEGYAVRRPHVSRLQDSIDGTKKWLLRMPDGQEIETVHIPEDDRGALCVSSQVGCTLTCKFCHTGTQRLVRNLTPEEIVGQVMLCKDTFDEWPGPETNRKLTNIVMMGMGEPLFNYENVAKALRIIMDAEGIAISKRRITLSTSGVAPLIPRAGEELGVMLAISLHAVRDDLRDVLVPLNKKYPIAELLAACRKYPTLSNARRITFEYVMLKGVNDSQADARELVRLIAGIPAKINLIPFNPWPGAAFERSTPEAIWEFADIVSRAGYSAPIRTPRGEDIFAACGQLKSASEKLKRSERDALGA
jgi:23S rRNA (adenine2503-C2)-methyltransferase